MTTILADLPAIRFEKPENDPHSSRNVGIDYIDRFFIADKRHTEKKYICWFKCLTTRVLHLETTDCLSTDMCDTAIRRLIARKEIPWKNLSDNATYFVGARKEIKAFPIEIDSESVQKVMTNHDIDWKMNPPSAPYFGGVRERLVSMVK